MRETALDRVGLRSDPGSSTSRNTEPSQFRSFTGATRSRSGLAEVADGGTLFLDEVGDIPLPIQVKLLRLLETHTFRRVGSAVARRSDFRLIGASLKDLPAMVAEGSLRQDLNFRINAFPIRIPSLRERADDVPFLVELLKERIGCGDGCRLTTDALRKLMRYDYPGNVRELLHILERACVLSGGSTINPEHLPHEVLHPRDDPDTVAHFRGGRPAGADRTRVPALGSRPLSRRPARARAASRAERANALPTRGRGFDAISAEARWATRSSGSTARCAAPY